MPAHRRPPTRPSARGPALLPATPTADAVQAALDRVAQPAQPLDVSMLDGFLCGVLLQSARPAEAFWLPAALDARQAPGEPGRLPLPLPAGLLEAVRARFAHLDAAIETRQWFDPWVYELDGEASVADMVLPWVGGFALAMEAFPALLDSPSNEVMEAAAGIYLHFDAEDLEDADALAEAIELLEPPQNLPDAVEGLVCAVLILADHSRPQRAKPPRR